MGAPLPLQGTTNPFTAAYLQRQFGTGYLSSPMASRGLVSYLASPPTAMVNAAAVTPLESEAEFFGFATQVITVNGSPASGTFVLQYGVGFTSSLQYNASNATIQSALRGLGAPLAAVTVTGNNGGPWSVTGFTGAGSVPLQLIRVRSISFSGGTNPKVVVTSAAEQQGIVPF